MKTKPITLKFELTPQEYVALSGIWRLAQISVKHMTGEPLDETELAELREILTSLDNRPQDFLGTAQKLEKAALEAGEKLLAKLVLTGKPTHGLVDLLSRFRKIPENSGEDQA